MNTFHKIALITGAGSGIGQASAVTLARAGWQVVLAGRRLDALQAVADQVAAAGGLALPVVCDVSQPDSVAALFEQVRSRFGRLDLLFNNAGISAPGLPMDELSFEQWQAVVGTNLTGSFLCAQQAMKLMKTQTPQGGRIINNGSISAYAPRPNSAPYTSTKHAITGLTKAISLDGRAWDIACSQIDVGNAHTAMGSRMAAGVPQANGQVAAEATMPVQHVADAVLHIASLPLGVNVQFMTVMATKMPFVGRG